MDVDREHKPAFLLEQARNHNSLSAEINSMDPIDRHIHLRKMADLAKEQENDPRLAKVKITLDSKGDPLDIVVESNSAWQRMRYGKTSDVYDTPAEIAAKESKQAKPEAKKEPTKEELKQQRDSLAAHVTALEIPGISDVARILHARAN